MVVKKTYIVWFFYFVTMTILLLDTTDNFPATDKLRLIRYPFLAYLVFVNLFEIGKKDGLFWSPFIFCSLLLLHAVLFGRVWVNYYIAVETYEHFRLSMVYFAMSILAARYCFWTDSKKEFLIANYFAFCIFLLWCYGTHPNGFAPVRYLIRLPQIFRDDERYGFTFGMIHRSLTANCASMAIIFAAFLWEYRRQCKGFLWKYHQILMIGSLGLFGVVLLSAASRGEILAVALYFMTVWGLRVKQKLGSPRARFVINWLIVLAGIGVVILLSQMVFSEGSGSNRTENLWVNYDAFKAYARLWTGMGYMEQHGFLLQAYRIKTWACDVFYLYIFFSSGILGSMLMGGALLWMVVRILSARGEDSRTNIPMKALVISEIFVNFFHCTIISYSYLASTPLLILFVEHLYTLDYEKILSRRRIR